MLKLGEMGDGITPQSQSTLNERISSSAQMKLVQTIRLLKINLIPALYIVVLYNAIVLQQILLN